MHLITKTRNNILKTSILVSLILVIPAPSASAAALSSNATPSSTVYGNNAGSSNFEEVTPPNGTWTTTTTTSAEGRRASYLMPTIDACNASKVTSLVVSVADTQATYADPVTDGLLGPYVHVVNKDASSPAEARTVSAVTSGTRLNGSFSLGLNPYHENYIVRGVTNPGFTTTPTSLPGSIEFSLDTTGMTVAQYKNLAITVTHDLLDGVLGFGDSMTTSQPTVSVQYDTGPCSTLADTGAQSRRTTTIAAASFIGSTLLLLTFRSKKTIHYTR